jgi:hypothetical protein
VAAQDHTYTPQPNAPTNPIFQHAATATPDPTLPGEEVERRRDRAILEARHAALVLLQEKVERWTQVNEITLDAANKAYISVTFLSLDLFMAVFQNNILAHDPKTSDVYTAMNNNLAQIAKRDELIFLVTVFIKDKNIGAHTLDLDVRQIILKNADDIPIPPQHDDDNLEQPIKLSLGPEFGYLYYPLAIQVNGVCKQSLDYESNTKINIETQELKVDSIPQGPFIWTIPYSPLVITNNSTYRPKFPITPTIAPQSPITQVELDASPFSPLSLPPVDMTNEFFWRDFGRFIWGQVTLENY